MSLLGPRFNHAQSAGGKEYQKTQMGRAGIWEIGEIVEQGKTLDLKAQPETND
jgi:hypothetical protein